MKKTRKSSLSGFLTLKRPTTNQKKSFSSGTMTSSVSMESSVATASEGRDLNVSQNRSMCNFQNSSLQNCNLDKSWNSLPSMSENQFMMGRRDRPTRMSMYGDWPPRGHQQTPNIMGFVAAAYEAERFDHYSQNDLTEMEIDE